MYNLKVKRRAQRAWERLPKDDFQAVSRVLGDLAQNPRPKGAEKLKTTELWRIRCGDYRIVYSIYDSQKLVIVRRIGHRREVYRSI